MKDKIYFHRTLGTLIRGKPMDIPFRYFFVIQKTKRIIRPSLQIFLVLFFVCALVFLYSFQFYVFEGGRDNYAHFFISKFAWKYPKLFLDHWGKPIYTLVTSPFAQFSIYGIVFFNCLTGVISALFLYKTAQFFNIQHSYITVIFLICSPMYFVMMMSAMTEILGAFILVISIYFYTQNKYTIGTIIFSSILLVRTEAFVFYPIVIIYLISIRKYSSIPLIFTCPLVFSLVGIFVYDDVFWLITKNPYSGASDIYGSGSLWHYVYNAPVIFGWPFTVFLVVGLAVSVLRSMDGSVTDMYSRNTMSLINALWIALLAAHSYAYWHGNKSSLGLVRVLTPILPLAAVTAGRGMDFIFNLTQEWRPNLHRRIVAAAAVIPAILQLVQPWQRLSIPFTYDETDKILMSSLQWLEDTHEKNERIIYFDLFVPYYLRLNPFDTTVSREGIRYKKFPEKDTKVGDVVVFDTRFGPNEGGVNVLSFMENNNFKLLNYFEPILPQNTLNNQPYSVYIFKRLSQGNIDNYSILDSIKKSKFTQIITKIDTTTITVNESEEYISLYEGTLDENFYNTSPNILRISCNFEHYAGDISQVSVCISFNRGDTITSFYSFPIETLKHTPTLDQYIGKTDADNVKIFIWNTQRVMLEFSVENLTIYFAKKIY